MMSRPIPDTGCYGVQRMLCGVEYVDPATLAPTPEEAVAKQEAQDAAALVSVRAERVVMLLNGTADLRRWRTVRTLDTCYSRRREPFLVVPTTEKE